MTLVTRTNIFDYIPQRDPFCLVHTIYECCDETIKTGFIVENGHCLVSDNYLTEAGVIENMAQSAAAHSGYLSRQNGGQKKVGFIGHIKKLKIHFRPIVDSEIIAEIKIDGRIQNVILISASSSANGRPLANCEMKIFLKE